MHDFDENWTGMLHSDGQVPKVYNMQCNIMMQDTIALHHISFNSFCPLPLQLKSSAAVQAIEANFTVPCEFAEFIALLAVTY